VQHENPEEETPQPAGGDLSDRERAVLVCVARGKQNKEIADELNISPHTVISHRKNIVAKTGIKSVAGLTVYALMNGLIEENEIL
jgi:DNA-binding CsgD family transcriptional regulator